MTEPLEHRLIDCPYCGEPFEIVVDLSAGSQSYVEDCHVCCRPVQLDLVFDLTGKLVELRARRDDE